MEMVSTLGKMEEDMKVATRMTKSTERASTPGPMEELTTVPGRMVSSMGMAFTSILTLVTPNVANGQTESVLSGTKTDVTSIHRI